MGAEDIALLRYAETCRELAAAYVERSTRFQVTDVRVLDARPVRRQFLVTVRHNLEVSSEAQDHHGVHKPGPADFGTADWKWYQEEVEQQARAELSRAETLNDLVSAVRSSPYAAISDRSLLRTHPRRLFHTYTCSGCHGAGKVSCGNCSGSGKVRCGPCSGSGRTSCSTCGGSGTLTHTRQVRDYNGYSRTETQHRSCSSCSSGRVNCFSCHGSGKQTCGTCGGSGRLTCQACSGHGYLTRVTTTRTYTRPSFAGHYPDDTPDYVHAALSKAGFANLSEHGELRLQQVNELRDNAAVEFIYECSMLFCELSIDVKGLRSEWVLFGRGPTLFDAGGALEALLRSDFDALAALKTSAARWKPWFHRTARQPIALFMESELNQQMIDASTKGLAGRAIVEQLNRSVSEAYVQASLENMKNAVRVAANWSRLKSLVALAGLAVPFAVLTVAYLNRSHRLVFPAVGEQFFVHTPNTTGFLWEMGLITVPFTICAWFAARWLSLHWLRKAGGERTVRWAKTHGVVMGKWTAATIMVAAAGLSGTLFNRWPLWIDRDGDAYGRLALFQPPLLMPVVAPEVKAAKKKAPPKRPKKLAPKPMPASVAAPAPVPHAEPLPATNGLPLPE
jgi:hypothetical protein